MDEKTLQKWVTHSEIVRLLNCYAQTLDERSFKVVLPTLFSTNCTIELPPGTHHGLDGLDVFHAAVMAPFARTQHVLSNFLTDAHDDQTSFRANALITHVELDHQGVEKDGLFVVGAILTGTAAVEEGGWRIQTLALNPFWRSGDGPGPDVQVE